MTAGFDALAVLARLREEAARNRAPMGSGPRARSCYGPPPHFSEVRSISTDGSTEAVWPADVDWRLTRIAARLSGLLADGADWRCCPAGGLDLVKPDALSWCLAPRVVAELQGAGLLPEKLGAAFARRGEEAKT